MNQRVRSWFQRNGAFIALAGIALLALLYLGDDIVNQRASRISLETVPPTVESDDPAQGAEDPSVTIVEFGDFTCSVCKIQVSVLKDIINDFGQNVRLVWKDAPLDPVNQQSYLASIAGQCAHDQGKFWEMHDELYEKQDSLSIDVYNEIAKDLKLNEENFSACVLGRDTDEKIQANIESAHSAKVESTPTFFINDVKYEGYLDYQEIVSAMTGT